MLKKKFTKPVTASGEAPASQPSATMPIPGRRGNGVFDAAFKLALPRAPARLLLPPTPAVSPMPVPLYGSDSPVLLHKEEPPFQWKVPEQAHLPISPPLSVGEPSPKLHSASSNFFPATPPPEETLGLAPAVDFADPGQSVSSLSYLLQTGHRLHPCMSEYDIVEELGAGGYGLVVKARRKSDGFSVAIKMMWRERMPRDSWITVKGWDKKFLATEHTIPREAYILSKIRHKGIVSYVDLFEDEDLVYLVMEYFGTAWNVDAVASMSMPAPPLPANPTAKPAAPGLLPALPILPRSMSQPVIQAQKAGQRPGLPLRRASCDLFECIERLNFLDERTGKYIFKQIVDAIAHCHERGIVHCDLKDENIVIDRDFRVKLVDFGSAVMLTHATENLYFSTFKGTKTFAAPEILRGEHYLAPKAEIFALGVLLSVLLTGCMPYDSEEDAMYGRIGVPKQAISREPWEIMLRCLSCNPHARPTIFEIQGHAWFKAE